MSQLTVYAVDQKQKPLLVTTDFTAIQQTLEEVGIVVERWQPAVTVEAGDDAEQILTAFDEQISELKQRGGYQQADVISLDPKHPDRVALRKKFLAEHVHNEDEVRFFVAGQGLFCLHIGENVYQLLCEKNDLINVPAKTKHWFDMGPEPNFVAVRLFINPEGWVAELTGNDIAKDFPLL
jgi:1,2-dihydroxy-3-keto-5-methylthiopentene dioxygenase